MERSIGAFPAADLLIVGDRIAEIHPNIVAPTAAVVDARGLIVMPGLIDTHRHCWQGAFRQLAPNATLGSYVSATSRNANTLNQLRETIASGAKQTSLLVRLGCFVADAPRNDDRRVGIVADRYDYEFALNGRIEQRIRAPRRSGASVVARSTLVPNRRR